MGTPDFAVSTLNKLIESGFNIVAVITAPDKPSGRGLKVKYSPVKEVALKHAIPVLQPTNLKSSEFLDKLKFFDTDLQVVVAFRMLPEVVWSMPKRGSINLHASLLPNYRGAAPINWAIINGEKETGVTTFFIQKEIDTGDILLQEKIKIENNDSAGDLHDKLMVAGSNLVVKTVKKIVEGNIEGKKQGQTGEILKKAPKIFKSDCEIDVTETSENIRNFVRGLSPYPGAWIKFRDKQIKIFEIEIDKSARVDFYNELFATESDILWIKSSDYPLRVASLQLEGKKRMAIEEFLRGNKKLLE